MMIPSASVLLIKKRFLMKTPEVFCRGSYSDLGTGVGVAWCVFTLMAFSHLCSRWVVEFLKGTVSHFLTFIKRI